MDRDDTPLERDLADALRGLKGAAIVPPPDAAREAALLAAFDAAHDSKPALSRRRGVEGLALSVEGLALSEQRQSKGVSTRRDYWYLTAFAAAAAILIAVGLPAAPGRHGLPPGGTAATHTPPPIARDVQLPRPVEAPSEFTIVPGAAGLPPMESGSLVRMDVPVSMLPSLGVTPPPGQARAVTADFIVAQDGLPRAVRLVSP
jgi:hypothetical protein